MAGGSAVRGAARVVLGAGVVAASWYALRSERVQRADVRAGDALRAAGGRRSDRAVVATTDLGSIYSVVGAAAVLAAAGQRRTALDVAGLGALTWSVAQHGKTAVRRQRPYEADGARRLIRKPTGSSFPSGHAAVAVATTTLLADRVRWRPAAWALRGVGGYVAASRVYVGVHYPIDVIGGAGVGLALAGLWSGPVAATGRGVVAVAAAAGARLLPPAFRVVLGVRRRPAAEQGPRHEAAA